MIRVRSWFWWGGCGIILGGKVAEWLKALVLKTRDGNVRRFESCPFRQIKIANLGGFYSFVTFIVSEKWPLFSGHSLGGKDFGDYFNRFFVNFDIYSGTMRMQNWAYSCFLLIFVFNSTHYCVYTIFAKFIIWRICWFFIHYINLLSKELGLRPCAYYNTVSLLLSHLVWCGGWSRGWRGQIV